MIIFQTKIIVVIAIIYKRNYKKKYLIGTIHLQQYYFKPNLIATKNGCKNTATQRKHLLLTIYTDGTRRNIQALVHKRTLNKKYYYVHYIQSKREKLNVADEI